MGKDGDGLNGILVSQVECLLKLIKLYMNSNESLVTCKLYLNKSVGYFLLLFWFDLVLVL